MRATRPFGWPLLGMAVLLTSVLQAGAQPPPPTPAPQLIGLEPQDSAPAPQAPTFQPTRDVTVSYTMTAASGGRRSELTQYYSISQKKKRIDLGSVHWIIDRASPAVLIVVPQAKAYYQTSGARDLASAFPSGSSIERGPQDRIADLSCTTWHLAAPDGFKADVCMTDDGVVLSVVDEVVSMRAARVVYGAVDARLFAAPSDWKGTELPPLGPTRDVAITYRQTSGPRHEPITVHVAIGHPRVRVDLGTTGYQVFDSAAHTETKVTPSTRSYRVRTGVAPGDLPGWEYGWPLASLRRGFSFVRGETATAGGMPCTQWRASKSGADPVAYCVTDDGVLLRAVLPKFALEATRVAYGPQPQSMFVMPAGFHAVEP